MNSGTIHEPMKTTRRNFLKGSAAAAAGSLVLGGCASAPDTVTLPQGRPPGTQPRHNDRAKGYLRFLWEKATTKTKIPLL